MRIIKYSFMVDGNIPVNALANTQEAAIACVKQSLGEGSDVAYVKEEFSHNVGDFESTKIAPKKHTDPKKVIKKAVDGTSEEAVIGSIVKAYARDTEVKL